MGIARNVGTAIGLSASALLAVQAPDAQEAQKQPSKETIALIQQLGDLEFVIREKAFDALSKKAKIDWSVVVALQEASEGPKKSTDAEIAGRAKQIFDEEFDAQAAIHFPQPQQYPRIRGPRPKMKMPPGMMPQPWKGDDKEFIKFFHDQVKDLEGINWPEPRDRAAAKNALDRFARKAFEDALRQPMYTPNILEWSRTHSDLVDEWKSQEKEMTKLEVLQEAVGEVFGNFQWRWWKN